MMANQHFPNCTCEFIPTESRQPADGVQLQKLFAVFSKSAFRLETLACYLVPEEAKDFKSFLAGEPQTREKNRDWPGFVAEKIKAGAEMTRVHVLPSRLSPYLRYEIEWCYPYSIAAGENVRFLLAENVNAALVPKLKNDFWLLDSETAIVQKYDSAGRWLGGDIVSDPTIIRRLAELRQELILRSISFKQVVALMRQGLL